MIIAVDTETQGLDATKFLYGCIKTDRNKTYLFNKKEEMWAKIIELGEKELKRKKNLYVYAHNHEYDFYAYADMKATNIKIYTTRPFIAALEIEGKECIKFLDTMALSPTTLEEIGRIINKPKFKTPDMLIKGDTKPSLEEIKEYLERDTEIVLDFIRHMRLKLDDEDIKIKRIYTISQVGVAYFLKKLRDRKARYFFKDYYRNESHKSGYEELIHCAYRGAKIEAFKLGRYEDVTYIDVNSLYPYASTKIRFPDLRRAVMYNNPKKEIITLIGVSRCVMQNVYDEYGLLPIRTNKGNIYSRPGKVLVGTWSNLELKKAVESGYKILDIEWSIIYNEAEENPYKIITEELYLKKLNSKNRFAYNFYKQMMNHSYGKLAQRRKYNEYKLKSVEEYYQMKEKGFDPVSSIESNYLYRLQSTNYNYKNYYAPIIPCLINAWSRVFMFEQIKKIPKEDLIYTDTDSIIFKGDHKNRFEIGEEMGKFKVEHDKERIIVYGRKTYCIGDEIKVSGMNKRNITTEEFKNGFIKSKKMNTIKTTLDTRQLGKFYEEERDLNSQMLKFVELQNKMDNLNIYIDQDITNTEKYINSIKI